MFTSKVEAAEHNPGKCTMYSRERIFTLNYKGENIEVRVWRSEESTVVPFKEIWELVSLKPELVGTEVKELLKEALTVFGDDGIYRQRPNSVVECRF